MKKGLTDKEKFCLCGYFITHDADTAYLLARGGKKNANDTSLHRMALRWVRNPMAQEYLKTIAPTGFQSLGDTQNRDKEAIITELNTLANQSKDPKERTQILMKLADLQNMKEESANDEETESPIKYVLPVRYPTSCNNCLLKLNGFKVPQGSNEKAEKDTLALLQARLKNE